MTDLLNFMGEHPILGFFIILFVYQIIAWPFRLSCRVIRHLNIRKAGWPPVHLDADGDAVEDGNEQP